MNAYQDASRLLAEFEKVMSSEILGGDICYRGVECMNFVPKPPQAKDIYLPHIYFYTHGRSNDWPYKH